MKYLIHTEDLNFDVMRMEWWRLRTRRRRLSLKGGERTQKIHGNINDSEKTWNYNLKGLG